MHNRYLKLLEQNQQAKFMPFLQPNSLSQNPGDFENQQNSFVKVEPFDYEKFLDEIQNVMTEKENYERKFMGGKIHFPTNPNADKKYKPFYDFSIAPVQNSYVDTFLKRKGIKRPKSEVTRAKKVITHKPSHLNTISSKPIECPPDISLPKREMYVKCHLSNEFNSTLGQ
jgi:hypothetical protein